MRTIHLTITPLIQKLFSMWCRCISHIQLTKWIQYIFLECQHYTSTHNFTSIIINNAGNRNGSYPLLYIEQYNILFTTINLIISSYMILPQIIKYRKIQYKNYSCVQVVRTSVNEIGHKTSMQKTYNSLPVFTNFEHAYLGMRCCVLGKWFPHFEGMLSSSSSVQGPWRIP